MHFSRKTTEVFNEFNDSSMRSKMTRTESKATKETTFNSNA